MLGAELRARCEERKAKHSRNRKMPKISNQRNVVQRVEAKRSQPKTDPVHSLVSGCIKHILAEAATRDRMIALEQNEAIARGNAVGRRSTARR